MREKQCNPESAGCVISAANGDQLTANRQQRPTDKEQSFLHSARSIDDNIRSYNNIVLYFILLRQCVIEVNPYKQTTSKQAKFIDFYWS